MVLIGCISRSQGQEIGFQNAIFSSPDHKVPKVSFCDGPLSFVHRPSVRASVNNFFKQPLLWNRLLDFDQTSQEWSLGGPLSKLFKPFRLVA